MSLYQCEKCGCVENTALGFYHNNSWDKWSSEFKDKKLCSECGPLKYPDGTPTKYGKWHGTFEKTIYPLGSLYTDDGGNTRDKATNKYSWNLKND